MPEDEKLCREWIRAYMMPQKCINHLHTSTSLRLMVEKDTRRSFTDAQFKRLMVDEGILPVDQRADVWEFRISSVPLRRRAKAHVGGWLPSMNPYNIKRAR